MLFEATFCLQIGTHNSSPAYKKNYTIQIWSNPSGKINRETIKKCFVPDTKTTISHVNDFYGNRFFARVIEISLSIFYGNSNNKKPDFY